MNVLLVDDDAICNLISRKMLEYAGMATEIHTAANGREAIDYFNHTVDNSLPDMVLLDLNMPVMDGFGFLEAFRKLTRTSLNKIKIVIVTSSEDSKDLQKARSMGVNYYLTKPITVDKLNTVLA
jgi:CheY-like chemotaxis protein